MKRCIVDEFTKLKFVINNLCFYLSIRTNVKFDLACMGSSWAIPIKLKIYFKFILFPNSCLFSIKRYRCHKEVYMPSTIEQLLMESHTPVVLLLIRVIIHGLSNSSCCNNIFSINLSIYIIINPCRNFNVNCRVSSLISS